MSKTESHVENAIDFNKIRKRRRRLQTVRRLLILIAATAALAGAVVLNNILVEQGITTRISDLVGGMGGTGYPVPVPGGVIRDVKAVGNHLAVLNDTNLHLYNDKGKQVGSFQKMSDNTVLLAGEDRMLTFDAGAKGFSVHSRTRTLLEENLEYGVFAGAMNARGDFAVVSSSKQAVCEITVYNKQQTDIYHCFLAENLASSVSVSPGGRLLAVGWLNGKEGVLQSGVGVYMLSNEDGPIATLELGEDLILDVRFLSDDRVAVLTDRQYIVMGTDGGVRHSYGYAARGQLAAFEAEGQQILLLCENRETRMREIVLVDSDCNEKAALQTEEKVTDMALAPRRVYILTENGIATYDHQLEQQDFEPVRFAGNLQLVKGRLYYLTREEIRVLGQAREESAGGAGESGMPSGQDPGRQEAEPSGAGPGGDAEHGAAPRTPSGEESRQPPETDPGPGGDADGPGRGEGGA